jgi:hypothetical protein
LALWSSGSFPFAWPEAEGLRLQVFHRLPRYRTLDARDSWQGFGFVFGQGWMGGVQAGEGNFMYRCWWLLVPYWFCGFAAGVVCTVVLARVRRLVLRRTAAGRV